MILYCTKNILFSYNRDIYIRIDGVAMGSLLGPVLAEIFMVNLVMLLVLKLNAYLDIWRWYVDDNFIKIGSVEYLLSVVNSFNLEDKVDKIESKLAFLDILLHYDAHFIIATVYRKVTNNDVYLNGHSFCPRKWKRRNEEI